MFEERKDTFKGLQRNGFSSIYRDSEQVKQAAHCSPFLSSGEN